MTDVAISAAVALEEERAMTSHLRTRCLVQAQAISELRSALSEREGEIADLRRQIGERARPDEVAE